MWQQWTWWQMSCEREFLNEIGIAPYFVWESVQPICSIRSKNELMEKRE